MKTLTKGKKTAIAILAVAIVVLIVIFLQNAYKFFSFANFESFITNPIDEKINERNAVSFATHDYFPEEEFPYYNEMKGAHRLESFVENCKNGESAEINLACTYSAPVASEDLHRQKLVFDGKEYTLTCDGHFCVYHNETELKSQPCDSIDCREQKFKHLKTFDVSLTYEMFGTKNFCFYVLTNIEDLTAEEFEENLFDYDSDVYKNSHIAYVNSCPAQE